LDEPRLISTDAACCSVPIKHNIRVELVKAGLERYWKKDGLFQSMIRVINVGDSERKTELPVSEMVLQDAKKV